jgi:hypothetical protein
MSFALLVLILALPARGQTRAIEAYYRHADDVLAGLEKQIPQIVPVAEAMAKQYVDHADFGLAVDGYAPFFCELQGRAGGIMTCAGWWPMERASVGKWKGVVLLALRDGMLKDDAAAIAVYAKAGCRVVLFGTTAMLEAARGAGVVSDGQVVVPSGDGRDPATPSYAFRSMAAGWVWTAEFVAACTRAGKMPVMFQSISIPSGMERLKTYETTWDQNPAASYRKFHDTAPPPVPAKQLSRAYLKEVREHLAKVTKAQKKQLAEAAHTIAQARAAHRRIYLYTNTHSLGSLVNDPKLQNLFTPITGAKIRSTETTRPVGFENGDVLLGIGYDFIPNDANNDFLADAARPAGVRCIWSAASYFPDRVTHPPGELFLDQHWELGDAVVQMPGYDIPILPASGLLSMTMFDAIFAEVGMSSAAAGK